VAQLLEGKLIAEKIKAELKSQIAALKRKPVLASILIGENAGSVSYANSQAKTAEALGVTYQLHKLSSDTAQEQLAAFIGKLNNDDNVNGIILQMPLPEQLDYKKSVSLIKPEKDVEGVHPQNMGKIICTSANVIPCTANAVMELINFTQADLYGKEAVIVGHSGIVGKPLALLLLEKFATVTVCHIATSKANKLKEHVARADVLIVATGKPELIKGSWIKEGAIVIDVGISRVGKKLVGDVEFETALKRASFITPVPGGVGPLTVAMLMRNLLACVKAQF